MNEETARDSSTAPEDTGTSDEAARYNTLGITEATQNRPSPAIASSQAIDLEPDNPGYYYNRGIVYANDGSPQLALQDFSHALELRGDDADILNNRGNVYAMLGDWDSAITDLTLCIELNPNQPEPYNNRAVMLAQKGEYPAAMMDFARAIGIKPQYSEAHF